MIKKIIRRYRSLVALEWHYFNEAFCFWLLTRKYNASSHTDDDREKMEYTLLRENHTIEKGMSMRNPHIGFGKQKVESLLTRLEKFYNLYHSENPEFLKAPLSTISNYIEYTEKTGVQIPIIKQKFHSLIMKVGLGDIEDNTGVYLETREHIKRNCNKDFASLLFSRHSIRFFTGELPSTKVIEEALRLAQQTPSACNRQSWKSHVFMGEKSIDLIKWQEGCRGFEDEIRCCILVTANMKAFLSYEVHQMYVDGGLYAMNLVNAFHSLGIGTIPLSTAFDCKKLSRLTYFDIPKNETPILIVGIGLIPDTFRCAASKRKSITNTTVWH